MPGLDPALAGYPEGVAPGALDRLAADLQPQQMLGRSLGRPQDQLKGQFTRIGVLRQDSIAK